MRLVKVSGPAGFGEKIAKTAFESGLDSVSKREVAMHYRDGRSEKMDVIDVETSTPKAKHFVERLQAEDYYDRETISFNIRQPRSLVTSETMAELTCPLVEPPTDLQAELWQFSHVTYGLIGRLFIAGCLLAYGLIEGKLLFIVGGLLFVPILPMVMAISYGVGGRNWGLARQGLAAFVASTVTLLCAGAATSMFRSPPMRFGDQESIVSGILISIIVGIAAALAALDDAGRRELIGLAAASQLAIIPVTLGIFAVFGLPSHMDSSEILERIASFAANLAVLIASVLAVQMVSGVVATKRAR